jgi:hypothetical protein
LYWIQHVFDPQTKPRANGKPRILICDGFGAHESLEVLKFCFENNIILCRIPSHTSHKLQPCDVGVFSPLKTAYREQVERLYRGGANTVGKQHFTLLYSRARESAFTAKNIKSGWSKAGLYPFDPNKVLNSIRRPQAQLRLPGGERSETVPEDEAPQTPKTSEELSWLRDSIKKDSRVLDADGQLRLEKLINVAERALAERALLLEDNELLFEQNNESRIRKSTKAMVVGKAKVMRYEDIVEAEKKREMTKSAAAGNAARPKKRKATAADSNASKKSRRNELEDARHEIDGSGLEAYCSVMQF